MKKKTRKIPLFTATLDDMRQESRIRWVLLGLIVAGTIVWMLAGVFQTPLKPDSFTNSRSYSPGGHRALLAMLRDRGYVVQEGFARLRVPEKTNETLVLLEPRPAYVEANPEEFQEAFTTSVFSSGSVLLVLPKRVYRRNGLRTPEGDIPLTWYFLSLGEIAFFLPHGDKAFHDLIHGLIDDRIPLVLGAAHDQGPVCQNQPLHGV